MSIATSDQATGINSLHDDVMYIIGQQDKDGNCAVHLAVMCHGMDANFERTIDVLESLRYNRFMVLFTKSTHVYIALHVIWALIQKCAGDNHGSGGIYIVSQQEFYAC